MSTAPPEKHEQAIAWLATIAPEVRATVGDTLRSTIIPPSALDTADRRVIEVFAKLSKGAVSTQLEHGDVIGEGGMGLIREATQVALGRSVAVKTLKPDRRDPAAALDLLREAWVTGSLEHPNVVPVHHLELDHAGSPVIVMKRISGVEWSKVLGDAAAVEKRFGATDLLAWNLGILAQVLNAVRFAHSRGVVHRDLKPSNVMIGDFGEVYLLDWGIAVSVRDDGSGRLPLATSATQLAGTPSYMAPEMLGRPGETVSERTDVYLAGAVLHELVTGRAPHEGTSAVAVFASVLASSPELPDSVPPELAKVVRRAMHVDPAERFASADELRLAIQAYVEHRGSAELAARATERLDELLALLAAPVAEDEAPRREALARLFGACRFGFHEALAVWRENADARGGLARATTAVAEYELATGNPNTAVTLLRELEDAPAELVTRARDEAARVESRRRELEALRADQDASTGRRTRMFLTGIFGLTFTILPLLQALFPEELSLATYTANIATTLGTFVALGAFLVWARNSMRATSFNRRIAATGVAVFVSHAALLAGSHSLGIAIPTMHVLMLFGWATVGMMLVIHVDRRLWPSTALYVVGFLLAARFVEQRFFVMAGVNLCFAINVVAIWWPSSLRMTPAELELASGRRPSRRE